MAEERNLESESCRKLFIGGLNNETTEDTLRDYFEHWGEIVDCVVMKEPGSRRSRGFGFVTFKKAHMVDDAQQARPHKIDNKVVETKRATPREESNKPESHMTCTKAYISGIKNDLNEDDLGSYFSKFGDVESVEIIVDHVTNEKRGFGFVTFSDYDAVDKIVLIKSHSIKGFRCDARKALSKEDMLRLKSSVELPERRRGRGRGEFGSRGGREGFETRGGRGGYESRVGRGRGGYEERRGFGRRGSFNDRDEDFGEREVGYGSRGEAGFSSRRGGYASRDGDFGNRDGGFARRDDFRGRDSSRGIDSFSGREGFGGREEFGNRNDFGGRDSYGGREDFGRRERFAGRDEFSGRDSRYERNDFDRGDGRTDFEGRAGYGGRDTFVGKEAFGSKDNYDGGWSSGGYGNGDRDDRFGREETRDGYGPDRGYGGGGGGSGNGYESGIASGRGDYDARQGSGFGTGYGNSRGGGPVKESSYKARNAGPYARGVYDSSVDAGVTRDDYFGQDTAGGREGAGFGGAIGRDSAGYGSGREGAGFGGSGTDYDERFSAPKSGFGRGGRGSARGRGGTGVHGRGGASRGAFDRW